MSTSNCGSGEQAGLAPATVKATRASTAPMVDYVPAPAGVPLRACGPRPAASRASLEPVPPAQVPQE